MAKCESYSHITTIQLYVFIVLLEINVLGKFRESHILLIDRRMDGHQSLSRWVPLIPFECGTIKKTILYLNLSLTNHSSSKIIFEYGRYSSFKSHTREFIKCR